MIWRLLSWPRISATEVGLLQQVAEVGLAVFPGGAGILVGSGDSQGGGQRDGAALHAFDQAFFALVEQEDDVFDVLGRQACFLDDDLGAVAAFAQHLDIGQDLQRAVAAPIDGTLVHVKHSGQKLAPGT